MPLIRPWTLRKQQLVNRKLQLSASGDMTLIMTVEPVNINWQLKDKRSIDIAPLLSTNSLMHKVYYHELKLL